MLGNKKATLDTKEQVNLSTIAPPKLKVSDFLKASQRLREKILLNKQQIAI